MKLIQLPDGEAGFLDANILVYHFALHPEFGLACTQFVQRIENQQVVGFTSTAVLSEVAHHLMTFEAAALFGWKSKVVDHLKQQPASIQQLSNFRLSIEKVPQLRIQVLTIPQDLIARAAALSQQYGLLSNDALIIAVIQAHGLTNLASVDNDFDRVPGITRYAPA